MWTLPGPLSEKLNFKFVINSKTDSSGGQKRKKLHFDTKFHISVSTSEYKRFSLYKEFFILIASNVSIWLFVVFSWLFFPSSFTRCMIKWRWYWLFLIIRFRFVLAFCNGKNFKWIPSWNFGILLMFQFDFLVFTDFFNSYEIFCVVVSFMSIYLLN